MDQLRNLKINKKIAGILATAGIVLVGGVSYALLHKDNETGIENEKGHSDISSILPNVSEEDFVVLNVGDHDSVGVFNQDSKIKYCNKKDISLGIIIDSDASSEDAIYDDVDYVKGLIRDYKIDFPVYLNINHIITDDSLNNEMKTKIIKDFLSKCSANNIYVGLYGTDTNLCRVKEYCGIEDYDAYLIQDSDTIKYDGICNVIEDMDGNITSKTNLASVISNKNLNDSNVFSNDIKYTVSSGEDITDIALKYGMSVDELLKFNKLRRKDIVEGTSIRIPCIISGITSELPNNVEYNFDRLNEPIIGCDISYAQGNSMDWDKLSDNFDFIILRCSQGLSEDSCFESNASNCNINNIPMGVYCYNDYWFDESDMSEFKRKEDAQADLVLSLLNNKKIQYPVYLDIEDITEYETEEANEAVQYMFDTWYDKMQSAGYVPGIYCNQSTFDYLARRVDYNIGDKFEVWIAGGDQYTSGKYDVDFNDVVPSTSILNSDTFKANMAQSTDSCVGAGAGNDRGHLDIDYSMVDYTDGKRKDVSTEDKSEGISEIKDFNRIDYRVLGMDAIGGLVLGSGIFYAIYRKKKSKEKVKRK